MFAHSSEFCDDARQIRLRASQKRVAIALQRRDNKSWRLAEQLSKTSREIQTPVVRPRAETATPTPSIPVDRRALVSRKYQELQRFCNTTSFREWGFSVGGPTNGWLKEGERMRKDEKFGDFDGVQLMTALFQLGFEYLETGGAGNKFTELFRDRLSNFISVQ